MYNLYIYLHPLCNFISDRVGDLLMFIKLQIPILSTRSLFCLVMTNQKLSLFISDVYNNYLQTKQHSKVLINVNFVKCVSILIALNSNARICCFESPILLQHKTKCYYNNLFTQLAKQTQ